MAQNAKQTNNKVGKSAGMRNARFSAAAETVAAKARAQPKKKPGK
ncbi:hypothetical protein [Cryobacterium psychrophilum]|nr:hypothetical protein [Cryobacterium psychrophilum]TDW30472.1 hypothetical protein EDD25_2231 [Cryobacterium psychrophilum]